VLDMFGINIKQAALDMKLMEMGFPSIAKGADETQKVLARMAIIKDAMGRQGAIGDAIKTAGSFSNQLKRLRGMLADTAAEIGSALIPVLTPLVQWAAKAAKIFGDWVKANHGAVRAFVQGAASLVAFGAGFATLGAIVTGAGAVLTGVATAATIAWGAVSATFAAIFNPITLVAGALAAGVYAWLRYSKTGQAAVSSLVGRV